MKIRQGFVSNSSSSSFVIHKGYLSEKQIIDIFNASKVAEEYILKNPNDNKFDYYTDEWNIQEFDDCIFGETSMDNFDMGEFLSYIGISMKNVCWDDGYIYRPSDIQEKFLKIEGKNIRKDKIKTINKKKK